MTDSEATAAVAEYITQQGFRCKIVHSSHGLHYVNIYVWGEVYVWASIQGEYAHFISSKDNHSFQVADPDSLDLLMDQVWKVHEDQQKRRSHA